MEVFLRSLLKAFTAMLKIARKLDEDGVAVTWDVEDIMVPLEG